MPKVRRTRVRLRAGNATKSQGRVSLRKAAPKEADGGESKAESPPVDGVALLTIVEQYRKSCCDHVTSHPECKEYAPWIEKYMRNQFKFFGLKSAARRAIDKQVMEANKVVLQNRTALVGVVWSLWEQEEREFQCFGLSLLEKHRQLLLGDSDKEFHEAMDAVKQCISTKSWWDTVDVLASDVVGYFVQERPGLGVPVMQQWLSDDNMWLRRTALLHQLKYKQKTDVQRLFSFCLERAHETEFFIRKAIGWSLRQYAWTNKKAVKDFVEKNKDSFSPLTVREALKNC